MSKARYLADLLGASGEVKSARLSTHGAKKDFSNVGSLPASVRTQLKGDRGNIGNTGAKGNTGSQGPTGATGPSGSNGRIGVDGDTGATGAQGPQGNTGSTGSQGPQGNTGATGSQGPVGNTGAKGNTGSAGSNGATGATGSAGSNGATGAKGNIGNTGAAGSNGATGATGSAGSNGATGAKGNIGNTGAAGSNGATGSVGARGPSGNTGAAGSNGTNGSAGARGPTGNTGSAGSNGATGATGSSGSPWGGGTFTGDMISNQRNRGNFGIYSSSKTDHIWSMGTAYRNHASGTNFGNLYGLAYKHTNNGTGGTMGGGHQMVWCNNGTPTAAMGSGLWTSGNVTAYSDARVKANLEVIPNAIDKVKQLNGYTYDRTDREPATLEEEEVTYNHNPTGRHVGVIAQEVLKVIPEAVTGGPSSMAGTEDEHYSVAYGNLVALLIEGMKEQQTQIDELKALIGGT